MQEVNTTRITEWKPPELIITKHARERFCERFLNLDLLRGSSEKEKIEHTDKLIREMVYASAYVQDNHQGVILKNKEFNAEFRIRCNRVITIINPAKRKIRRQRKLNLCDRKGIKP